MNEPKLHREQLRFLSTMLVFLVLTPSTTFAQNGVGCEGVAYPDWETSAYVLPFAVGETYRVELANCSSSFHGASQPDKFAYDFAMDIGTPILASRAGTVVYVEEAGRDFEHPNNLVVIDHGDDTFAQYMHLTQDGAEVAAGNELAPGDLIGYSGATGLAGYPHLHFIVTRNGYRWPYEGTPVTFSNTAANPRGLESYTPYEALPY